MFCIPRPPSSCVTRNITFKLQLMDLTKESVKPTPFASNLPEASVPMATTSTSIKRQPRSKQILPRYDVWSEDVNAAFMEAMDIYPSMGTQRTMHVVKSQNDDEKSARTVKRLGRCQLIQMYILEMTGKHRTQKQISSHIQRLKKMSKNEPNLPILPYHDKTPPPAQELSHRERPASSLKGTQKPHHVLSTRLSSDHASPFGEILKITHYFEEQSSGTTHIPGLRCDVHNRHFSSGEHTLSNITTIASNSASTSPESSLQMFRRRRLDSEIHSLRLESEGPISVHSFQVYSPSEYHIPRRAVARDNSSFSTKDPCYGYSRNPVGHNIALDNSSFHVTDSCSYQFSPVDKLFPTPLQAPRNFERQRTTPENTDGRCCHWSPHADKHSSSLDLGLNTFPMCTTGIDLAPVSEPSLSVSDMQSSPICTSHMGEFISEHESQYPTRGQLPDYGGYDTSIPYTQDVGSSQAHLVKYRQFDHPSPNERGEEQLTYPSIIKPQPRYHAAYMHTEDHIPEPEPSSIHL